MYECRLDRRIDLFTFHWPVAPAGTYRYNNEQSNHNTVIQRFINSIRTHFQNHIFSATTSEDTTCLWIFFAFIFLETPSSSALLFLLLLLAASQFRLTSCLWFDDVILQVSFTWLLTGSSFIYLLFENNI